MTKQKALLVLLVATLLLTACGGKQGETAAPSPPTARPAEGGPASSPQPPTTEGERETITFACRDYQLDDFEPLVKGFEEANPDLHVQLLSASQVGLPEPENTTGQEIETLAAGADTFLFYVRMIPQESAFLLDLSPFVDDPAFPKADFFPNTLDTFRWQGKIYGLPATFVPWAFFYDKEVFDAAGIPYPQTGWSWDDLAQLAAQLTQRDGDRVTRYGFVDQSMPATILAMLQSRGVILWYDQSDPPQPAFDTPEVAAVIQSYVDMVGSMIMPAPEIGSNITSTNLINDGRAAIWNDFAFGRSSWSQQVQLGMVPFPGGITAANPRQMDGFFISAGTAHPEAAWRWLSYLSANYQPSLEGFVPGRRSLLDQSPWWTQLDEGTRAVYEYILAHLSSSDSDNRNVLLIPALNGVFLQGDSVEEALASAQAAALEWESGLAQGVRPTPRPAATPLPEPGPGQKSITYCPSPAEDMKLYYDLAATFQQENPDLTVEITSFPLTTLDDLASNRDCFGWVGPLAGYPENRQYVLPLGPLLDADSNFDLSDYYPQFLALEQQEGELWGLPYKADALMVYYNKDRFSAVGLALPGMNWTMQDFLSDAAALSGNQQFGFTTREGAYGDLVFVLQRLGAHLYDDTGDQPLPTLDDSTVVAALGQYADFWRKQAISPSTPSRENGWPDMMMGGMHAAGVESGQVAMWVESIDFHSMETPLSFPVGVAPLPVGTTASTEFLLQANYISARTDSPQACWKWLTFLSSRPEIVNLLPVRRSMADSAAWQAQVGDELLPAYRATLAYQGSAILNVRWDITWLAYSYPWLDEAFQATVNGKDPAAALVEAQARATALFKCLDAAGNIDDREQAKLCAKEIDPEYPEVEAGQ